jgi:hypothetical protein
VPKWRGIRKVTEFLVLRKTLQIISSVSNHTSCRQIFEDYNILMLSSLYILKIICYIKNMKFL